MFTQPIRWSILWPPCKMNLMPFYRRAVGEVMFYGRAGSLPTGSAVCADVMDAARVLKNEIENGVLEATFTENL